MKRTTQKDLNPIVARINRMTGSNPDAYTLRSDGHTYIANVGNYHLDRQNSGWMLAQMVNEAGAARDVLGSGHVTARELQGALFAFIAGWYENDAIVEQLKGRLLQSHSRGLNT